MSQKFFAYIFKIDPETKSSWIQIGDKALPISIVTTILPATNENQSKQQLRLIGTDDDKNTVLNTAILETTVFKKRSAKFGQFFTDTETLYGLGFDSESNLDQFIETFQQLQNEMFQSETHQPYQQQLQSHHHHHQQQQQQQHFEQQQRLKQQPSTSIASTQSLDQPDKSELVWGQQQQQQQLHNEASEMNGSNQKATRYNHNNNNNNNNINMNKNQHFNSNTLAHPGHQAKHQQQQLPPNQHPSQVLQPHQQRQILSQSNLNSTNATAAHANLSLNNGNSMLNGSNNVAAYPRSQSMFGMQGKPNNNQKPDVMSLRSAGGGGTPDTESSTGLIQNDWQIREQLKYENDRLKQALEESSRNAGVWHNELITLRTNNVKLTQALEESKVNVEEWAKELKSLTNENKELKLRLSVLESGNDVDSGSEHKKELQKYKSYVEEVQNELRRKENEIEDLQKSMEMLELKAKQQNGHTDESSPSYAIQKQKLEVMSAKFGAKISELVNVQKEFAQYLDRMNN